MINIVKYQSSLQKEWDNFINLHSKNGVFFLQRTFMEYHKDRFEDYSLMIYSDKELIALLPGNTKKNIYYSHQGLSFGGFILKKDIPSPLHIEAIIRTCNYLKEQGFIELYYKAMPPIFHSYLAEECLYALFQLGAQLVRKDLSTLINLTLPLQYKTLRRRGIKKALQQDLVIRENSDFTSYWKLLSTNLKEKHQTIPTHSLNEIHYLKNNFPEIKLYEVYKEEELLAGIVMYQYKHIAHSQYISASSKGKELGALDFLIDYLIKKYTQLGCKAFDFGISTEQQGTVLNQGLITQKEGFGGQPFTYDFYSLNLGLLK